MRNIKKLELTIIHCLMPLLLGGFIYLSFRSKQLRMFDWFTYLNFDNFISYLRELFFQYKIFLPNCILYSIPDGLWVYSFTSALLIAWEGKLNIWLSIPLVAGPVLEIAQLLNIFPGTFDIMDLLLTITAFYFSFKIITYNFIKINI
jgi:hypothetical protein